MPARSRASRSPRVMRPTAPGTTPPMAGRLDGSGCRQFSLLTAAGRQCQHATLLCAGGELQWQLDRGTDRPRLGPNRAARPAPRSTPRSTAATTAFSSATDVVDVTVTAVNDAPVLADTALTLTVAEDAGAPSGTVGSLVSAFTGGITDVDAGAVKGIAITASNETNGTWYYTTDGGTTWTAVGAVSSASSLLLADNASTRLYFAPAANYNGSSTSALTLRGWDQTSGAAGTKVDTSTNGGSTAFSSATDVVDVDGHRRQRCAGAGRHGADADRGGRRRRAVRRGRLAGQRLHWRHLRMSDSGAVRGIAITASDETHGTWYYTTDGGTTWTAVGAVSSASSLLLADNASTRLYFAPAADYNGSSPAALTIRAWDQTSGHGGHQGRYLDQRRDHCVLQCHRRRRRDGLGVNDAPVLADTALALTVYRGRGAPWRRRLADRCLHRRHHRCGQRRDQGHRDHCHQRDPWHLVLHHQRWHRPGPQWVPSARRPRCCWPTTPARGCISHRLPTTTGRATSALTLRAPGPDRAARPTPRSTLLNLAPW